MDIAQYIADLLKVKDEVAVPSFGTFYTKPVSAFFDQASNLFIPPGRQVFFRSEVADPAELVNYISREKNLSRPSSRYFAEKFGETLRTEIDLVGRAEIHPLGSFEKGSQHFLFSPSEEYKHISNFGLFPVEEIPAKSSPTVNPAEVNTVSATLSATSSQGDLTIPVAQRLDLPDSTEDSPTERGKSGSVKKQFEGKSDLHNAVRQRAINSPVAEEIPPPAVKKSNGLMVAIALFTVLVAAAFIAYFNYPDAFKFLNNNNTSGVIDTQALPVMRKGVTDTPALSKAGSPDSVEIDSNGSGRKAIVAADTVLKEPSAGIRNPQEEIISFEIIGASLQTKKEAESYIRAMKARGIEARIVENKPGRYIKVSIGSFSDAATRDAELGRIRKDVNKNAWPLDIKIKR